jgi:hypothetical protein
VTILLPEGAGALSACAAYDSARHSMKPHDRTPTTLQIDTIRPPRILDVNKPDHSIRFAEACGLNKSDRTAGDFVVFCGY